MSDFEPDPQLVVEALRGVREYAMPHVPPAEVRYLRAALPHAEALVAYVKRLEAVAEAARPFVRGEAEDGDPATEPDEDWMVSVTGAELTALITALAALREDKP